MRGCDCGDTEGYRLVMRHSTGQKYSDVLVEVKVDEGKVFIWG